MNEPLGGTLVDRMAGAKERRAIVRRPLPRMPVPLERQLEAWNIATGAYSPLAGFMGRDDTRSVLKRLRLASGVFWPIPIILDIDARQKQVIEKSGAAFLADERGEAFALLEAREIYRFPKQAFARGVFGTVDPSHPGVARVEAAKDYLVAGPIAWIGKPLSRVEPSLTPRQARALFKKKKWERIVAFHTRNVPHRGHEHIQREGLRAVDGLFVQPLVGRKKSGDFRNEVVAKAYRHFVARVLPRGKAVLSFLPYSAYFAGPREALLTAAIRKNFGCTHFIVGRDHTGVGDFYSPADYAGLIRKYRREMGIEIFHFGKAFWCRLCEGMAFDETCPHGEENRVHPSGTLIRRLLVAGKVPPPAMMRPEIARVILKERELFV